MILICFYVSLVCLEGFYNKWYKVLVISIDVEIKLKVWFDVFIVLFLGLYVFVFWVSCYLDSWCVEGF